MAQKKSEATEKKSESNLNRVSWVRRIFHRVRNVIVDLILIVFVLGVVQSVMDHHWIWRILLVAFFVFVVYLGLRDLRQLRVDTEQAIQALVLILVMTISVFSVLSVFLYKSGYAHYTGFSRQSEIESSIITLKFIGFYTWQLFEVIPALNINQAMGWNSPPLTKSGLVAGLLVLGFRATLVLLLLKEFIKWWTEKRTRKKPALDVILKRFEQPDETRLFKKGKFETVQVGGMTVGRATYEPGWKWSEHVGTLSGTSLCQVEHIGLVISGRAVASLQDRRDIELKPDVLFYIPPVPHDSWVIGDEPYVSLHFLGGENYTK